MPRFEVTSQSLLRNATLVALMLVLSACGRQSDAPAPAAPAASPPPAITPQPAEAATAAPSTGPAEGGTAIGGVVGNQDEGGASKGKAAAPTGGDGSTAKPPEPPAR